MYLYGVWMLKVCTQTEDYKYPKTSSQTAFGKRKNAQTDLIECMSISRNKECFAPEK